MTPLDLYLAANRREAELRSKRADIDAEIRCIEAHKRTLESELSHPPAPPESGDSKRALVTALEDLKKELEHPDDTDPS